jgi:very-short-patch-repair endonuclease
LTDALGRHVLKAKLRNSKLGGIKMKKGVNIGIFAVMFILDER